MRTNIILPLAALLLLCSAPAWAETATCPVTFAHEEKAFKDLVWDSGWLPKNEDIQIRFKATAKGGINVDMPSTASLVRGPPAHQLSFAGAQNGGLFKMGLETTFKAYIKINKKVGSVKIKYDGELPLPGKLKDLNKVIGDQTNFTPLVLPGAAVRPVKVALTSPKYHIITIDTPLQVDVKVASVKVRVPIYMQTALKCDFKGKQIVTTPQGSSATVTNAAEGLPAAWADDTKLTQQGSAVYYGERELHLELSLLPEIEVKAKVDIGVYKDSKTWKVAEFKVSTDLVKDKKDWTFSAQPLAFTFTGTGPDPLSDGYVPPLPNDAGVYPDGYPAPTDGTPPIAGDGAYSWDGSSSEDDLSHVEGTCAVPAAGGAGLPAVFFALGLLLLISARRRSC